MTLLLRASANLTFNDIRVVLDPYWYELVRMRLSEISNSELGLNMVKVLLDYEDMEIASNTPRDMRDQIRDVRGDRQTL